tara:strand:+ start:131 stop:724 length:594 start_codon:yes stop_codon:yes gene_type:complete
MKRKFAIIGHRAQSKGKLNLNDLAGSAGRLDVLLRAVNTSLFISHGIRHDTEITLHLQGGPGPIRRVIFDGALLRGVRPDERAIAGHIAKALKEPVPSIGQMIEFNSGLLHSGGGIKQTIDEWKKDDFCIYILDADGRRLDAQSLNSDRVGFVLSDDMPFTDEEKEIFEGIERVSLGDTWLQGHACISIIHHHLDHI